PIGKIGQDAFGNVPVFEDKGKIKRVILNVGRQDVDPDGMIPLDKNLEILGASSDHLIVDISQSTKQYQPGDTLSFELSYGSLLRAMTSPYIKKKTINGVKND
ncbi:MAG: alanine/ornithine racemase family PLP-dependent enzyme, partial [Spirochaetes bacterium]|nr:alanine/ornithine racemase family PLP-dependent enzyme [Spirochaetota bacterium]